MTLENPSDRFGSDNGVETCYCRFSILNPFFQFWDNNSVTSLMADFAFKKNFDRIFVGSGTTYF